MPLITLSELNLGPSVDLDNGDGFFDIYLFEVTDKQLESIEVAPEDGALHSDWRDDLVIGTGDSDWINAWGGNNYILSGNGRDTIILDYTNSNRRMGIDTVDLLETVDSKDVVRVRLGELPIFPEIVNFDDNDRIELEFYENGVNNFFTTNNGVGDTLLYISHGNTLSIITVEGVDEQFVYDRTMIRFNSSSEMTVV